MVHSSKAVVVAAAFLVAAVTATTTGDPREVTVHEWGTFTSIAGEDGRAVQWRPLSGPTDLPSFVRRAGHSGAKGTLTATVRMETPVLYFYAAHDAVVNVTVGFRQGLITEHFPRAMVRPRVSLAALTTPGVTDTIAWTDVRIQPAATPVFPTEDTPNHYYAARDTNAAPLRVGSEQERFLFYRGVGSFALPLAATVAAGGEIHVANAGSDRITALLLFENRGGRIGWRAHRGLTGQVRLSPPAPDGDLASLRMELEQMLIAEGLYSKEATAMVDTWSDAWFEEGTRLFYVLPQRAVDSILPLEIRPAPANVVRVFVGRLELVTAASLTDLRDALWTNDRARLARFGRFLRPFVDRLLAERLSGPERARIEALLEAESDADQSTDARQSALLCR